MKSIPSEGTQYQVQLPVFQGPLDLLLSLIEQEELDITKVSLARVTDQYLAYLAELQRHPARDLAEFIVIAAKLLLIKSKALLPQSPEPEPEAEEDVGDELVRQLKLYKKFKDIAQHLEERKKSGLQSYVRLAALPKLDPQPDLSEVSEADLLRMVQQALDAVPAPPVDEVVGTLTVTIEEQIAAIQSRLQHRERIRFQDALSDAVTKTEVIITLLALLELIKQNKVRVRQERLFGDIFIERFTSPPMEDAEPTTSATP